VTVSDSEDNLQKSLYEVRKISENVIWKYVKLKVK
jgi:hypothetical protein